MKEIGSAAKRYIRTSATNQQAILDPLSVPDELPLLCNFLHEAMNRGYRYKDLKLHIKKIYDDWLAWKDIGLRNK